MSELILTNFENIDADRFRVTHIQNVTPILEANRLDRLHSDLNWQQGKDMKHAARVPMATWLLWESMGITSDDKLLMEALNRNPEYKTTEKTL